MSRAAILRRVLRPCLAALVLCVAVAAGAPAAAAAAGGGPYVALGDSYTAAPLVPNQVGRPLGCARSDRNYPSLVARELDVATFVDVSCSSAETQHMTAAQSVPFGTNAPQFDGLRADARLVTVGIGGNDVGLVGAALTCARLGLAAPTGSACRSHYTSGGTDRIRERIAATAPRIAAVVDGIGQRAPLARIVVVGYPDVLPRSGNGCWPLVPFSRDDVRYFDGLIVETNRMLATQAAARGAQYADTYYDSVGHDVCTLPGTRWFEGLVPTAAAFPLHPNALGEASMARSVLRTVRSPASRASYARRPRVKTQAARASRRASG